MILSLPRLYLFFGAPGSGKSEALGHLAALEESPVQVVRKETTRPPRESDGLEIECVQELSDEIDIRYFQYHYEYGMASRSIWEALASGSSAAAIVNDVRTLHICRKLFGSRAVAVYLHSNVDEERMRKFALQRHPDWSEDNLAEDLRRRILKIGAVHSKYVANLLIFDYTVLNEYQEPSAESLAVLHQQVEAILGGPGRRVRLSQARPRIFAIVGATFSGKDDLVNAMQQLEPDRAEIYQKYSTRPERRSDKGELRHVETMPATCDLVYSRQGFEYGISIAELWEGLSTGVAQLLVVSDVATITRLKQEFGEICTALYLHASFDRTDMRKRMQEDQLESSEIHERLAAIEELHEDYVSNMLLFDHVLLNTAEPEDLYDEAFSLLDFYS